MNFRPVNYGLCVHCRTVVWNRTWQIVGRFLIFIEFKVCVFFQWGLNNMGWIRIRTWTRDSENSKLDPEYIFPDPQYCSLCLVTRKETRKLLYTVMRIRAWESVSTVYLLESFNFLTTNLYPRYCRSRSTDRFLQIGVDSDPFTLCIRWRN